MTTQLFLRQAVSADEAAVFEFYRNNTHPYVFGRDPDVWRERIANGAVTMIEDGAGQIVAAAIGYPVVVPDSTGAPEHIWSEVGSVNVALKHSGLFTPMVAALVLRAYFLEPPAERFVAEIKAANEHSKHVFQKDGWRKFEISDDMRDKIFATVVPEDRDVTNEWFYIDAGTIPQLAQYLLAHIDNPSLTAQNCGCAFDIDFSRSLLATDFRAELSRVAGSVSTQPGIARSIHLHRTGLSF